MEKRGQVWSTIIAWIVGIIILVLAGTLYFIFNGDLSRFIDYFKGLGGFGG